MWSPLVLLLGYLLLRLQDLAQHLGLSGHKSLRGVMGDDGGSSLLPVAPNPLGELHVGPTI
jgi:hypothetical protein